MLLGRVSPDGELDPAQPQGHPGTGPRPWPSAPGRRRDWGRDGCAENSRPLSTSTMRGSGNQAPTTLVSQPRKTSSSAAAAIRNIDTTMTA